MFKRLAPIALVLAILLSILPVGVMAAGLTSANRSASAAAWCGGLSSYTAWYSYKPALFVWKGQGRGNPYDVKVRFDGATVPNAANGVQTYSGPQIDRNNGWVGYYISTRWYLTHWRWDDDWRWQVSGCLP